MKPETAFARRVDDFLKSLPCYFVNIQQKTVCGIPDRLVCIRGQFVAMELKAEGGCKATRLQEYNLKTIERNGGLSFLVTPDNFDAVKAKLEQLLYTDLHEWRSK